MTSTSIADCMIKKFAHITADLPVVEAAGRLAKNAHQGGPVVDAQGVLVGWISEQECLRAAMQVVYHNQRVASVGQVMQREVITVTLDHDLMRVAENILNGQPTTYPVVDANNRVLGILTRREILQVLDRQLATLHPTRA